MIGVSWKIRNLNLIFSFFNIRYDNGIFIRKIRRNQCNVIIAEKGGSMKMLITMIAVLGMSIGCFANASHGKTDAPAQKPATAQNAGGEIVVIEGVTYTDCCALDPASPCVKNGKCTCKSKKDCGNCMKHMKKCGTQAQGKCAPCTKTQCPQKNAPASGTQQCN